MDDEFADFSFSLGMVLITMSSLLIKIGHSDYQTSMIQLTKPRMAKFCCSDVGHMGGSQSTPPPLADVFLVEWLGKNKKS